jgi:hypothetical protein
LKALLHISSFIFAVRLFLRAIYVGVCSYDILHYRQQWNKVMKLWSYYTTKRPFTRRSPFHTMTALEVLSSLIEWWWCFHSIILWHFSVIESTVCRKYFSIKIFSLSVGIDLNFFTVVEFLEFFNIKSPLWKKKYITSHLG